jgi:hypothetical protein
MTSPQAPERIRIAPRDDWRKHHWPARRDNHSCSDPFCPEKVCRACGLQIQECIERQRESR